MRTDVTDRAQCDAMVASAVAKHGGLDLLVVCAGAGHHGPCADDDTEMQHRSETASRKPLGMAEPAAAGRSLREQWFAPHTSPARYELSRTLSLLSASRNRLMNVNYFGAINCIKAALPHLIKSKGTTLPPAVEQMRK